MAISNQIFACRLTPSKIRRGLLLCIFLIAEGVRAQTTNGNIVGHVSDPAGAAIVGASVELQNEKTGQTLRIVTGQQGDYIFPNIEPGTYRISTTSSGFKSTVRTHVVLDIAQTVREDEILSLGSENVTVQVSAAAPLVESETSELGTVIDGRQIQDLPLNGRNNIYGLLAMAPGVQRPNSNSLIAGSSFQGGTTQTVDGMTVLDLFNARVANPTPTLEDVAEFNLIANNAPAEYGRGGAQLIIQTKQGGSQFHGSLFAFNRNRYFAARNYFLLPTQPKQSFNRNEFGGSIGGPVLPLKRLFFFFSFEDYRRVVGSTATSAQPLPAFIGNGSAHPGDGDFSAFLTPNTVCGTSSAPKPCIIYDPVTGLPIPGNIIPAARISPTTKALLAYYSMPNTPTATGLGTNFTTTLSTREFNPRYTIRGDYQISKSDHIFVRYYQNLDGPYQSANGGTDKFGNYSGTGTLVHDVVGNYTRVISSHIVNEFLFGFNKEADPRIDQNGNVDPSSIVPGLPTPPAGHGGLPQVSLSQYTSFPAALSNFDNHQHLYQVNDNLSWAHGQHSMKFGAQFLAQQSQQGGVNLGNFSFDGRYTGHYNFTNSTKQSVNPINSFADYLLGYMYQSSTQNTLSHYNSFGKAIAIYGEDNWQVLPRLTFNIGLRYEKSFPYTRELGGLANFYPNLGSNGELVYIKGTPDPYVLSKYPAVAGSTVGINEENYYSTSNTNLSPRLGFAFRPTGTSSFVIRGGYSLIYNYFASFVNGLGAQPPFLVATTYVAASNTVPNISWANPFPSGSGAPPANISLSAVEQHPKTPYNEQANLTIEKEFFGNLAFRVSYLGNFGRHLVQPYNLNDPAPGPIPSGSSLQALRPYQPWGAISQTRYDTSTNANELQVGVRRRFADLMFEIEFQHVKALGIDGANDGAPTNRFNLDYDYGNLDFYSQNYAAFNHSYLLPFGRGKRFLNQGGLTDYLVGGWKLSGIALAYSGQPFFVSFTSTLTNWPSNRASQVAGVPVYPAHKSKAMWFNSGLNGAPAPFVTPAPYTYGNQARNGLYGPGFVDYDPALSKTTTLFGESSLEFRVECFNLLNHPNFGVPARNINASNNGQITATTNDNRELQFGARLQF